MKRVLIDHSRQVMAGMTVKAAIEHVGTIGFPSKMPGTSFGIPAQRCHVGGKLHNVPGSVCEFCYAWDRGNYGNTSVHVSQANRFDKLTDPQWVESMAFLLHKYHGIIDGHVSADITDPLWHRWHDSGDLQSEEHLDNIVAVCRATPRIKHWLPTREIALVSHWLKSRHGVGLEQINEVIPRNLCIRFSATMVDGAATARAPNTSTVHKLTVPADGICPAPQQDNKCGKCRKCWDKNHANTSYHIH